jgi:small-conductance mechanosensitive channel
MGMELIDWLGSALGLSESSYVNAALFLVLVVAAAKSVDLFIDRVLRNFTKKTKGDLDDNLLASVHQPIYHTIALAGVLVAAEYLWPGTSEARYVSRTIFTVIALTWSVASVRLVNAMIEGYMNRDTDTTGLGKDIIPLVENLSLLVIITGGIIAVMMIWHVNITPLLASAGIVGAAVAFASKDTISNFFGGVSVFMDRPYKIGDYIVLDAGERGEVVAIGVRSTRIKTRDDVQITIPNSIMANTKITNESAPFPNYRIRIPISVAYGTDIDLVENTLLDQTKISDSIIDDPAPRVRFRSFGDSGLNFELLCWVVEPSVRGFITHELNRAIYKRFAQVGIVIPFPQRDVHIMKSGGG